MARLEVTALAPALEFVHKGLERLGPVAPAYEHGVRGVHDHHVAHAERRHQPAGVGDDGQGNVVVNDPGEAPVLMLETSNSVVVAHSRRLVATLGVQDVVVVDTPDVVLVCGRDRAQGVKSLVDELKSRGEGRFL